MPLSMIIVINYIDDAHVMYRRPSGSIHLLVVLILVIVLVLL